MNGKTADVVLPDYHNYTQLVAELEQAVHAIGSGPARAVLLRCCRRCRPYPRRIGAVGTGCRPRCRPSRFGDSRNLSDPCLSLTRVKIDGMGVVV